MRNRLGASLDPEFREDIFDVRFDGLGSDAKPPGNFLVRPSLSDKLDDLDFPRTQRTRDCWGRRRHLIPPTRQQLARVGHELLRSTVSSGEFLEAAQQRAELWARIQDHLTDVAGSGEAH